MGSESAGNNTLDEFRYVWQRMKITDCDLTRYDWRRRGGLVAVSCVTSGCCACDQQDYLAKPLSVTAGDIKENNAHTAIG